MRTLYTFDKHNYSDDMEVFERFAVRAVIIRDGKLAMQQEMCIRDRVYLLH